MHYVPESATNITAGLDMDLLRGMTADQRAIVAVLMARAAERSYRRGLQQGATIAQKRPADLPANIHDWRYGISTDASPWADSNRVETSLHRLHTENGDLRRLGFPVETDLPTIDEEEAATALDRLARAYLAEPKGKGERRTTQTAREIEQALLGLGGELFAAGGSELMRRVFWMAAESSDQASLFVTKVWGNVEGWSGIGE